MRETLRDKIRQWYILGIAVFLIFGGAFLASLDSHRSSAATVALAVQALSQAPAAPPAASAAPEDHDAVMEHAHAMLAQRAHPPRTSGQAAPVPLPVPAPAAALAAASPSPPASTPATTPVAGAAGGDDAAGRQVFRKCQACHSIEPGKTLLGPSLSGIVGRKAGSESSYSYSPAMKQAGLVWDVATLDAYLADPEKVVPGNKMPFPGLKTGQDRTDVIAFLAASEECVPASRGRGRKHPRRPPPRRRRARPVPTSAYVPDAKYTLRSGIAEGRMVYIGVGGEIDGKVNPVLTAAEGQVVQLTVINGEGAEHDIVFPSQDARSPRVTGKGASTTIAFRAAKAGDFIYFCSVPGPSARRHARSVHRHPEAAGADAGRGRHLARAERSTAADRKARPQDGAHRPARASRSKGGSRKERPSATGRSTAKCRDPFCASGSATRSTSI